MKQTKLFVLLMAMVTLVSMSAMAQDKKADKKKKTEEVTFVTSMFCINCQTKIERHLSWEKGVKDIKTNLDKKTVTIKYDPSKTTEETLKKVISDLEYTCEKVDEPKSDEKKK
jgi:copper chaperone CopZ